MRRILRFVLRAVAAAVALGVVLYVAWSVGVGLFQQPAARDVTRAKAIVQRYPNLRVGLTLSGGGYRAAVFHAGVLSALEDLRIVPATLTSVSGGSIISSYYAVGGDPREFLRVVGDGRLRLTRELFRVHNLARLPLRSFSRSDVQANLLDRILLGGRTFDALDTAGPTLMIATTDLATGQAVGITRGAAIHIDMISPTEGVTPAQLDPLDFLTPIRALRSEDEAGRFPASERIARAVAASGAFPLALPPIVRRVRYDSMTPPERVLRLADGGLSDNTGLTLTRAADRGATLRFAGKHCGVLNDWHLDLILMSDAGAIFAELQEPGWDRVSDIVYARVKPNMSKVPRHRDYPLGDPVMIPITPQTELPFPLYRRKPQLVIKTLDLGLTPYFDDEIFRAVVSDFSQRDSLVQTRARERQARRGDGPVQTAVDLLVGDTVDARMQAGIDVFVRTGTLSDGISRDAAARLFALGRYLTFKRFTSIDRAAKARILEKTSRPPPPPDTACD